MAQQSIVASNTGLETVFSPESRRLNAGQPGRHYHCLARESSAGDSPSRTR